MHGLLHNADDAVAHWAFQAFRLAPSKFDMAVGIVSPEGALAGAILFQAYNGHNVEVSYYGPHTMTPGIIRTITQIAIQHFGASRLTAVTSKRNKRFMRGLLKLGFVLEGHMHRYYGDRDCPRNTGVRLVMWRERLEQIARLTQEIKAA
jgi:RimJ/RimL family protein N-acetyltransferase